MTVPVQIPRDSVTAANGVFTYSFGFDITNSNLQVWAGTQIQIDGSDYTIDSFDENGGTVTFTYQVPQGTTITFVRETPQTQQTDYQAFDSFPAQSHEDALDKQMRLYQEMDNRYVLQREIPGPHSTMGQTRIRELADPQDSQDAVNFRFLETYVDQNAPPGPQGDTGPQGQQGEIGPVGVLGPPGTASQWYYFPGFPDPLIGLEGDNALNTVNGDVFQKQGGVWVFQGNIQGPPGTGTTNDHSGLINLGNDDHPQYLNEARGDARYPQVTENSIITGNWAFQPSNINPSIQFRHIDINQPTEVRVGGSNYTNSQSWSVRTDTRYIALQVAANGDYGLRDVLFGTWALLFDPDNQRLYTYTGGIDSTRQVWTAQDFTPASFAAASHTHDTSQVNVIPTISQVASTTLQRTDEGRKREFTDAAVVTVDTLANQNWTPFCTILIRAGGSGQVTITPGPGVTLRSFPGIIGSRSLAGEGAHALLHYRPDIGPNTWDLDGKFT